MPDVLVVKVGGSTLGAHDTALEDVVALQHRGLRPVVVPGGGALIPARVERRGEEMLVFVGEGGEVGPRPLVDLLGGGCLPVLAPIGVEWRGEAPGGQLL